MSRTRASAASASVTAKPQQIQIQPGHPGEDEDAAPNCSGHQRRCSRFTAGAHTKNAGRVFYTCPLGKDDPNKCKYFKWEDELGAADKAQKNRTVNGGSSAQTLGRSPDARYGRPVTSAMTPTASRMAAPPITPLTGARNDLHEDDGIEWERVDVDSLEADAICNTPGSTQVTRAASPPRSFQNRLQGTILDGAGKRKRDEDDGATPKRRPLLDENPFLNPPALFESPPHASLSPALSSLGQLSDVLHRQDRLVKAGEAAKEGFRKTIKTLQARNKELEDRVKALERQIVRR